MQILSPVAERKTVSNLVISRLNHIHGTSIAFLENGWRSGGIVIDRLEELLRNEHDVRTSRRKTETSGPDPEELYDAVAQSCDAAIVSIAN